MGTMAPETDLVASPKSAAVMLQKTYRGHRARRKLADAAVMSKAFGWWNIVDSVVLQEHTQQYYAHSKSWKAIDNWKRLKRKAGKVGKGLAKDNQALKLALQHWLEAIDPRHRYGHNLRPYYVHWLKLETCEPFFYWLDVGGGRNVEVSKCSRAKLQLEQITYLSPKQRKHYEVVIYEGELFYKASGELVHTPQGSGADDRWIFVLSPYGKLYIGKKKKGVFQHSSFLAGGATTAAGRLLVNRGILQLMEAHSGHYRPSPANFETLVRKLTASGADLSMAKVQLVSDDLIEKKQGKKLAEEVREAVEETCAEEHVAVRVEKQSLVSVDSGLDGSCDYIVTNLTFPKDEPATSKKKLEHTVEELVQQALSANQNQIDTEVVQESPGFSRNSSLASLRREDLRQALNKYVVESASAMAC